jgi:N-methylhydantoinase B
MQLDHHLEINEAGRLACRRCGHELCDGAENFKEHVPFKVRPIQEANPLITDPKTFVDDEVVFRQYFCPGCATLLENEVILASSQPVWDKQISLARST